MYYTYDKTPLSGFERNDAELWHMLLLALAVTRTIANEITVSQPQTRNLADSFQCLRTIAYPFFQCEGGYDIPEGSSQTQGHIAKDLATARNLEYFHIRTAEHTEGPQYRPRIGTTFRAIFGGCTFPRLKSFTLWCIDSTEEEFLEFLEGSPFIEYLELDSMALMSGEHAANITKAILPLKELVFRQFNLGLPQPFSHVEFDDVPYIVEKLFFGSGRNPFIKAIFQELHSLNRFSAS
ncbi:hypothetical protein ABVK25_007046 [Lepraria finkii]|uniref:Uncharacterized protein n=1 Tax=Lepraria finkii TaxID=1340010 RepID=A0ABR4B4L3_9LECA